MRYTSVKNRLTHNCKNRPIIIACRAYCLFLICFISAFVFVYCIFLYVRIFSFDATILVNKDAYYILHISYDYFRNDSVNREVLIGC